MGGHNWPNPISPQVDRDWTWKEMDVDVELGLAKSGEQSPNNFSIFRALTVFASPFSERWIRKVLICSEKHCQVHVQKLKQIACVVIRMPSYWLERSCWVEQNMKQPVKSTTMTTTTTTTTTTATATATATTATTSATTIIQTPIPYRGKYLFHNSTGCFSSEMLIFCPSNLRITTVPW